ncbi:TlpA family protein disulfide reductase [Melioribacter sp. OK-6-Me]|uniref:TlpA family protein disulfide reductase n=1 Tax=unclassified Melioribacter TaxID=2627329 RepID=UPI003ED8C6F6
MRKLILIFLLTFTIVNFISGENQKNAVKEIKVVKINKDGLNKIIKNRNGKILFLNLWATWCVPCREEIPDIVKLAEEYRDVDFVGLSVDLQEDINSKVIPFLKSNNVFYRNFINGFDNDEELINFLEEKWNGALPATLIYDSKGKKIAFLDGKKSYKEFKEEIERARNKK